jgi:PTH1 family peptidyl-tRNA hydrolase
MKLIVGLGNPGPKYALTRHNIGFLAMDALNEIHGGGTWKSEHKAETVKLRFGSESALIAKPQTFMNLSGQSVVALMQFYQIAKADLLVVQDEVDLPFGGMKFVTKRGAGGHNGIRNITELTGGDDYARLRLGVGKPPNFVDDDGKITRSSMPVADWVLNNFSKDEVKALPDFISKACQGIEVFVTQGLANALNQFNQSGHQK